MTKQRPEEESFKDQIMKSLNHSPKKEQTQKLNSTEVPQQTMKREQIAQPTPQVEEPQTQKAPKNEGPVVETASMRRKKQRHKEDRIVNRIVTMVVLVLAFIGTILLVSVYSYVRSSIRPLDPKAKESVVVEIPPGSSNKMIGEILQNDNVIKSGTIFNYYTKFNNLTGFQAGKYELSAKMSLEDIGKQLQQGATGSVNADSRVTIPEGYDIDQIGDTLAKSTSVKKEDFIKLMQDEDFFNGLHKKYPELLDSAAKAEGVRYRLEGYLFPATYDYYKGATLEDIVTQMVDKTNNVMSKYYEQIRQKNMTVQEVLTLASLVEKEGVTESDRKNIAQVFFNRLNINMALQSDIAILYALGEHKELVTIKDTQIDSPYNLYVHTGFGPGPFDNPSEQAIQAVMNPTSNNYLYFVADLATGKVYYAEDFEKHNVLVDKYVNKTTN